MNTPEFIVGFKPETPEAPAHFFIANGHRAACCAPLDVMQAAEAPQADELAQMAALCWQQLTGDAHASPQLVGSIIIGWLDALKAHMIDLIEQQQTRH